MSRLLTKQEFADMYEGLGWVEAVVMPEEGEEEETDLERAAWTGLFVAFAQSGFNVKDNMLEHYGEKYRERVWIGERAPTAEEMAAVPWIEREGSVCE